MSLTQSVPTIEDITRLLVSEVLQPLSRLPRVFARASLHVAIESNHNWTIADHIAGVFVDNVKDGRGVTFCRQQTANAAKVGFWTTHNTKEHGVQLLRTLLSGDGLCFDAQFFGHKQWLHDQIRRLRKIRTRSNVESGNKYIITGKTQSHNSVDCQDDQAISLLIGLYVGHQWIDAVKRRAQLDYGD